MKRRDPSGYYVLVFKQSALEKLKIVKGLIVEVYGDSVIVRVRSRSLAKKLVEELRNHLAT